jgi:hypothetical protein
MKTETELGFLNQIQFELDAELACLWQVGDSNELGVVYSTKNSIGRCTTASKGALDLVMVRLSNQLELHLKPMPLLVDQGDPAWDFLFLQDFKHCLIIPVKINGMVRDNMITVYFNKPIRLNTNDILMYSYRMSNLLRQTSEVV